MSSADLRPFPITCSYLPAFFLKKLVGFLENVPVQQPGDEPRSLAWGYVYCLGLLSAALMDAVVSGQLWFGEPIPLDV